MVHVLQQKQIFPWLQNEVIFYTSPLKKIYDEALDTLQKFTKNVILEKREQFESQNTTETNDIPKGRVAFLDLLLQAVLPDGSKLSDADIQESENLRIELDEKQALIRNSR